MNEKTMVADTLAGINGELVRYGEMIPQTENPELKQTLKQIRNQCEMSQEEIYRIARTKGYYVPAAKATREEVEHVRSVLIRADSMCKKGFRRKICGSFFTHIVRRTA